MNKIIIFRKNNNRGTTMVETLVAFVVLMIVLLALYKMVSFSSQLRMRSVDTSNVLRTFNQEIYGNAGYDKVQKVKYVTDLTLRQGKQGPLFYIEPEGSDGDMSKRLWVTDINAYSYSYDENDPMIKDEKIMAPKALVFVHQEDDK